MHASGPGKKASGAGTRRCPDCGALVSEDARWCGQCFRSLLDPMPEPAPIESVPSDASTAETTTAERASTGGVQGIADAPTKEPTWPCPACGNENPIELDVCVVCGTSFAAMMRHGEPAPTIDPADAVKASLLYPGLGHRRAGRSLDGLARGVLFTLLLAMAILTGLSGLSTTATVGIFVMYVVTVIVVYVGTAFEARHIAAGGEPFIGARTLLWITVGLILASVALVGTLVVFGARS